MESIRKRWNKFLNIEKLWIYKKFKYLNRFKKRKRLFSQSAVLENSVFQSIIDHSTE